MWILISMILMMPFEVNPYLKLSSSFLGVIPDFTFIKLLGLIGLIWVTLKLATGTELDLFGSRQAKFFFGFLFIVVLAGLANGVVARPLSRVISIVCLLPVVLAAVRTEKNATLALKVAAASLIVVFPYGYRQTLRFGGRYGVGLYESNYIGIALVLMIPVAFVFARHAETVWSRRFWRTGVVILLISLVLTGSRGAFIGLVMASVFLALKLSKHRLKGLLGIGAGLLLVLVLVPNPLLDRLIGSLDPAEADSSIRISNRARMAEVEGGLRMVRERPLAGVGLGNFKEEMKRFSDLEATHIAHNMYLEIAAELGLPALLAFLLLLRSAYRSLSRSALRAGSVDLKRLRDLAWGLQAGLLGYMISALFLSAQFEKYLWLTIFCTICLERITVRQRAATPSVPVESRSRGVMAGNRVPWRTNPRSL